MIYIFRPELDKKLLDNLHEYQKLVQQLGDYEAQCLGCEALFIARRKNITFENISSVLKAMCSGATRCMYCEDSSANSIDHHKPKNRYPEETFQWQNFVYACGRCNSPKGNRFNIFDSIGNIIEIHKLPKNQKPPLGHPLLIDPTKENPFEFMKLDLLDSYEFQPLGDGREAHRAAYTIELLKLNEAHLVEARKDAYLHIYQMTLERYFGAPNDTIVIERCRSALQRYSHPTVWREMVRQWQHLETLKKFAPEPPQNLIWW